MLIRQAEVRDGELADVRVTGGFITQIQQRLEPEQREVVVEARGGALIAGLHDHHVHLAAMAASAQSVACGPPAVKDAGGLAVALRLHARPGLWIRGIGYHERVAGEIDRDWLDQACGGSPVRVQHRSGRLWVFNSAALERLGAESEAGAPFERAGGRLTGRLFEGDDWLRKRLGSTFPDLSATSRMLAMFGVTKVTDATPHNDDTLFARLAAASAAGELLQDVIVMGRASLRPAVEPPTVRVGPLKIHLDERSLPEPMKLEHMIRCAVEAGRPAAIHCVSLGQLAIALDALQAASGTLRHRLEHASVVPDALLPDIRRLGLTVVVQPHFVRERGDAYLSEVPPEEQSWLYRLRSFAAAGIPMMGGTDAPFGGPNPWESMQSAVDRRTAGGLSITAAEALSPEMALKLISPGQILTTGHAATLCLLDRSWAEARLSLGKVQVQLTLKRGRVIGSRPP